MARPLSPLLTREKIAKAAIEMIDAGHELKMQPLATRLGVSVSSLYHHVDGREGIIHAMREVFAGMYSFDRPIAGTWREAVEAAVSVLWRLYSDHPRAMIHLLGLTVDEPGALEIYTVLVDALRRAGLPDEDLLATVEVLDAFALGVALDSVSPTQVFAPADSGSLMAGLIADHPSGDERNRQLFRRGLDFIITGIEARVG